MCAEFQNGGVNYNVFTGNTIGVRRIVKYIFIVCLLFIECFAAKTKVCKNFKTEADTFVEKVHKIPTPTCPQTLSDFNIYAVDTQTEKGGSTPLSFLICWTKDVSRFALQFDSEIEIKGCNSFPTKLLRTCTKDNDTVFFSSKHHEKELVKHYEKELVNHLLLPVPEMTANSLDFKAYYDQKGRHLHGHHRILPFTYQRVETKRKKRAVVIPATDQDECGKTIGCYRHGPAGCGHFTCDYFLAYNATSSTVEFQMSAKTNGWLAVGFSSDRSMGGDEVIVCSKTHPLSTEIQVGSYKNPYAHQESEKIAGTEIITVIKTQMKDGYIYCHLSRPLSADGDYYDLTNNWYQLYAIGPVSPAGGLDKHTSNPRVSKRTTSIINKMDEITSASSSSEIGPVILVSVFTLITHIT